MIDSILIIQENGRHERNREFRECFALQRAFKRLGVAARVWGPGHESFDTPFESVIRDHDAVLSVENYDNGWHPDLSGLSIPRVFWCIDAHVDFERLLDFARKNAFDIVFNASKCFVRPFMLAAPQSEWLPNAYDETLIDRIPGIPKTAPVGFCGNVGNRGRWIDHLVSRWGLRHDQMVLGPDMVRAVNAYQIHWNRNLSVDINYRTFETLGCGTFLLTNRTQGLEELFEVGEHLVVYEGVDDLDQKIERYLSNPEERERIAELGYKHVRGRHTFVHRAEIILERLEALADSKSRQRLGGPRAGVLPFQIDPAPEDLPEGTKNDLEARARALIIACERLGDLAAGRQPEERTP